MYKIRYADGRKRVVTDIKTAFRDLRTEFGFGCHMEDFGDRWFVWASYEDSRNDDGAKAIALIRAVKV